MGAGEFGGVIRHVSWRILDDTDKVVDSVFLVIRNDEEDLGQYIAEFHEVGVRGLAGDGIEFLERFIKEGVDVVRHHCVHEEVDEVGCWYSVSLCSLIIYK